MQQGRTGVWIVGACGGVAVCSVFGAAAMAAGLVDRTGLVTELAEFRGLGLIDPEALVFGGCDVRRTSPVEAMREFADANGIVREAWIDTLAPELEAYAERIVPGMLVNAGDAVAAMADWRADRPKLPAEVDRIRAELRTFRRTYELDRVVVVNLASAEPRMELSDVLMEETPAALRRQIESGKSDGLPLSVLYAYSALEEGCAYVNFTASVGASTPALQALAREQDVPVAGRDGKTGETLVKTVLAPLFHARHFKLLSWESHNILGNRDGQILNNPLNKADKISNKTDVLKSILNQPEDPHHAVHIDFVPSLGDWKTAWDFIHFEGFLGAKMSLQFTWQGSDSCLAAPLVLDLVRLADFGLVRGESGVMTHTACFFKHPEGTSTHDFHEQFDLLQAYAISAEPAEAVVSEEEPVREPSSSTE